MKHNLWDVFNQ